MDNNKNDKKKKNRKIRVYKDLSDPINDTLVMRIQAGDDKAYEPLVNRCESLLKKPTHNLFIKNFDKDDLYQESCVVLVEAVWKYEKDKGMSFNQYVCLCLDNHFSRLVRWDTAMKRKTDKESLSLDGLVEEYGHQLTGVSKALRPEEAPILEETITEYISALSPLEKAVCLYYLSGDSYSEIAEKLQCSKAGVMSAKHRCSGKYKKFFI